MGDTPDGSSGAAHSALTEENDAQNRGFFGRILDAFGNPSDEDTDGTDDARLISHQPQAPGLLNLRRMRVEDVAIPKSDIKAVSVNLTLDDLWEVFRDTGLTRLPVFEGTLDTPIGNVNMKDFALAYGFCTEDKPFDLRGMLRPLIYVPPSMPLGVLLQKMQQDRIHMALVIDEYGGTDGLVTIEDLVEQVVGAIEDEHDAAEEAPWVKEKPGIYLALSKTPLSAFEQEIGMVLTDHEEIDEEEIDTLGGLVFMLSGHVPARGEVIVHPDGPEFEVLDADPRRIKRMRVRMQNAAES